jgi:hypothetical protein
VPERLGELRRLSVADGESHCPHQRSIADREEGIAGAPAAHGLDQTLHRHRVGGVDQPLAPLGGEFKQAGKLDRQRARIPSRAPPQDGAEDFRQRIASVA